MICSKCKIDKPESEFYKGKSHPDVLRKVCKGCDKAAAKGRYFKNREKRIQQRTEWGNKNKSYDRMQGVLLFKGIRGGKTSLDVEDLKYLAIERLVKLKIAGKIDRETMKNTYKNLINAKRSKSKEIINNIFSHNLLEYHNDKRFNQL